MIGTLIPETLAVSDVLPFLATLLGGGGLALIVKSLVDFRAIKAKAHLDDTSATISLTAAARELVDPLRSALAEARAEHATDLKLERAKLAELRQELEACTTEAENLRGELAMARVEADELRRDRERYREKDRLQAARISDLERMLDQA